MNRTGRIKTGEGGFISALAGFCPDIKILRTVPYYLINRSLSPIINLALIFLFLVLSCAMAAELPFADVVDVKEKIEQLKDKNMTKRVEAILDLGKSKDQAAKKALLAEFKKEKNVYVKTKIVESLGKRHDKSLTAELIHIAKNETDADVRNSAVRSLGYSKDESVIPVLIEKFQDEKETLGIRLQSADALTNYPEDRVFDVFAKALNDKNIIIKEQALVSLYNGFGWDAKKVLPYLMKMASDPDAGPRARQYLKNLGTLEK